MAGRDANFNETLTVPIIMESTSGLLGLLLLFLIYTGEILATHTKEDLAALELTYINSEYIDLDSKFKEIISIDRVKIRHKRQEPNNTEPANLDDAVPDIVVNPVGDIENGEGGGDVIENIAGEIADENFDSTRNEKSLSDTTVESVLEEDVVRNSTLLDTIEGRDISENDTIPSTTTGSTLLSTTIITTPILSILENNSNIVSCNRQTHKECDVDNFERCSQNGICECLRGYANNGVKCVAVQFFRGTLRFKNDFVTELNDETSNVFRKLHYEVRTALFALLHSQNLPGLLDVQVLDFTRGSIIVLFEILLDKDAAPRMRILQEIYQNGISTRARPMSDGNFTLMGTNLILEDGNETRATLLEYNPCVDSQHNYCDINADCTHSMKSFTCKCQEGYEESASDFSRETGEQCSVWCGCRNNGTCEVDGDAVICRCPQWYIGDKCEVNGKDLLIIICSVLGGLLLLTLLICLICVCAVKKRAKSKNQAPSISTGDSSLIKLPRLWMDTSRPYENAPRDTRRWSYVSEPIRYADELMMDEHYHSETLPLPRTYNNYKQQQHIAAYQNPSYHSSTLPLRPPYQQEKWRHNGMTQVSTPY